MGTHIHTTTHTNVTKYILANNLQEDMELLDEERKLLEYVNDVDHDIEGINLSLSLSLWKGYRLFILLLFSSLQSM